MCTQHRDNAHLTQADRHHIEALWAEHHVIREVARCMQIDVSTISRELRRNAQQDGTYCADYAQKKSIERRRVSRFASRKIENNPTLAEIIETALRGDDRERGDWSPEVIAHMNTRGIVSHPTIYAWIKRSRRDLYHLLPHQGRRRIRYGSKKAHREICRAAMPSIDLRPACVATREDVGHFEGDTVLLKEGRIHTLAERKSRFLIADLITVLGVGLASEVSARAVRTLSTLPLSHRQTIDLTPSTGT